LEHEVAGKQSVLAVPVAKLLMLSGFTSKVIL
jgi:hypothetical protein